MPGVPRPESKLPESRVFGNYAGIAENPVFRERAGRHRLKLLPRIRPSRIETEGVR
jgi:hypothetical protein